MGAIHVHLMPHVQMKWAAFHVTARMASEAMTHLVKVGNRVGLIIYNCFTC